ncbi:hypothetical protein BDZ88DRAFT_416366 [Geranomyces variabilis]|nr:hypothetical protein BDZ88DRAFT_416366 [Geranomyces variabilis]
MVESSRSWMLTCCLTVAVACIAVVAGPDSLDRVIRWFIGKTRSKGKKDYGRPNPLLRRLQHPCLAYPQPTLGRTGRRDIQVDKKCHDRQGLQPHDHSAPYLPTHPLVETHKGAPVDHEYIRAVLGRDIVCLIPQ